MHNGKPTDEVEYLENGMKVLDRQTFGPIHMLPGDMLSCEYHQHVNGIVIQRRKLAVHECTKAQTIDTAIIVELDNGSLQALGLKSGLAGIFGEAQT